MLLCSLYATDPLDHHSRRHHEERHPEVVVSKGVEL